MVTLYSSNRQTLPAELYVIAPLLALSTTLGGSFAAGLLLAVLLIVIAVSVSLLRHFIAWHLRLLFLLLIIATWTGVADMLVTAYLFELRLQFGIYLPLLACNSLVFAMAEGHYLRMPSAQALVYAARSGLVIILLFLVVGLVRELLSSGSLEMWHLTPAVSRNSVAMAGVAPGALISAGLLIGLWNHLIAMFRATASRRSVE